MDHALQTISYIADIGSVLVIMARRRLARQPASQAHGHRLYKMICHVFHSDDVSSWAPGVLRDRRTRTSPPPSLKPTWPHCHPTGLPWSSVLAAVPIPLVGPTYSNFFHKTVRVAPNSQNLPCPRPVSPDSLRQQLFSQNSCRLSPGNLVPGWER